MALKIFLNEYEDPASIDNWEVETKRILADIEADLSTYPHGALKYEAAEYVHPVGADWVTILMSIISLAGSGFFAIPAAHKKIRETLEEWKRIKENVDLLFAWLSQTRKIVAYPIEVTFLDALERLESEAEVSELEILEASEIPHGEYMNPFPHYLFAFREGNEVYVLAYDQNRKLLWFRHLKL